MVHQKLKCVVALLVAMAAWLVASPVLASEPSAHSHRNGGCARECGSRSAPLCDARGATMFGPTPTLDAPDASIDVGSSGDETASGLLALNGCEQGRTHTRFVSDAPPEAVLTGRARVMCSPLVGIVLWYAPNDRGSSGVRPLLERPPRAA